MVSWNFHVGSADLQKFASCFCRPVPHPPELKDVIPLSMRKAKPSQNPALPGHSEPPKLFSKYPGLIDHQAVAGCAVLLSDSEVQQLAAKATWTSTLLRGYKGWLAVDDINPA